MTRAITVAHYQNNRLRLQVPEWLFDQQRWAKRNNVDSTVLSAITEESSPIPEDYGILKVINIEMFSSYQKLLRVTAFVMLFVDNCRKSLSSQRVAGFVTVNGLRADETLFLRSCQSTNYQEEIADLSSYKKGPSIVKQLGLFIDGSGLMKCNRGIHNSPLDEQAHFPYLLSPLLKIRRWM